MEMAKIEETQANIILHKLICLSLVTEFIIQILVFCCGKPFHKLLYWLLELICKYIHSLESFVLLSVGKLKSTRIN